LYRQALAHGHTLLGQLLHRRKPGEAEPHYRKALELRQKLADDFRGVPEYVHDLARSHNDLGLLLRDLGRRDEAEAAFRRAVALTRKMLDVAHLPQYQNGLGIWLNNLALLRVDQGRLEEARDFLNRAIPHKQAAVKASPSNAGYRLSLRTAYLNLGNVLEGLRQGDAAEAACRRALEVLQESTAELRSLPGAQSDLGATLNDLSMLLIRRGKLAEARRLLEQAVTHQRAALRARPRHPTYRLFLRHHYVNLADALQRLGKHAEAAGVAEKLSQVFPEDPVNWYEAAGLLALCVSLTEKDAAQTPTGRAKLAKTYADRAMQMLNVAVAKGFKHLEAMKRNAYLKPLRSREDFKKLLAKLEAQAKQ
jgi:tetratricopeptide (TPR) repeat protein